MKKPLNTRQSDRTHAQLAALVAKWGDTKTNVLAAAIDNLYSREFPIEARAQGDK